MGSQIIVGLMAKTRTENVTSFAGVPSWMLVLLNRILTESGKENLFELWPNLEAYFHGGVSFEPYREQYKKILPNSKFKYYEIYNASEGFFAYQDSQKEKGMLLLLNSGIFYEFIKSDEFYREMPRRYTIGEVELNVNYVLIISTNAGLWGYNIGDTVQFTSLKPYRIIVSGRIKHYISAFGEHVIGKEVESALQEAIIGTNIRINEFTVAPQITPAEGLPYHEWFIEFENEPEDSVSFAEALDTAMRKQNMYYDDLIVGKVLRKVVVTKVAKNGFQDYMKSIGKLGGQNKIPRLSNDRKIVVLLKNE